MSEEKRNTNQVILNEELLLNMLAPIFLDFPILFEAIEYENMMENVMNESLETSSLKRKEKNKIDISLLKEIKDKEGHKCTICLESNLEGENNNKYELECGHIFHIKCIKEWTYYMNSCPICRKEIKIKKKEVNEEKEINKVNEVNEVNEVNDEKEVNEVNDEKEVNEVNDEKEVNEVNEG